MIFVGLGCHHSSDKRSTWDLAWGEVGLWGLSPMLKKGSSLQKGALQSFEVWLPWAQDQKEGGGTSFNEHNLAEGNFHRTHGLLGSQSTLANNPKPIKQHWEAWFRSTADTTWEHNERP